jgi:hypothetical protein
MVDGMLSPCYQFCVGFRLFGLDRRVCGKAEDHRLGWLRDYTQELREEKYQSEEKVRALIHTHILIKTVDVYELIMRSDQSSLFGPLKL